MTEQHEADPGDRFAGARRFPSRLDPPSTGGGAELGELVQLYSTETRPLPTPNPGPVSAPPVVASGPGSQVGCCCAAAAARSDGFPSACTPVYRLISASARSGCPEVCT